MNPYRGVYCIIWNNSDPAFLERRIQNLNRAFFQYLLTQLIKKIKKLQVIIWSRIKIRVFVDPEPVF